MRRFARLFADYGIVLVLVALAAGFSIATLSVGPVPGIDGGEELANRVAKQVGPTGKVVVIAGTGQDDAVFADALEAKLKQAGVTVTKSVGSPLDARKVLEKTAADGPKPDAIAASWETARWTLLDDVGSKVPVVGSPPVVVQKERAWPTFLSADNLLNVANQIAVIAILAAGMTLVIVTGGIDLSVGSLIALSAVLSTWLVRRYAGAEQATAGGMLLCGLTAVLACGLVGAASGAVVTRFDVPPFIITLGVMLIASGAAARVADNQSIYQLPDSFRWLGIGADLGVPNAVVLAALVYAATHVALTRTSFGRYVYAVGENAEAARLAGVRVGAVRVAVYAISGLLAGVGGVVMASQFKSGSPVYGKEFELYVIAAVVVGGTSLGGGEGNVLRTLLGALVIGVIRNGMNQTGIPSDTQRIVLGGIIVAAVLIDRQLAGKRG